MDNNIRVAVGGWSGRGSTHRSSTVEGVPPITASMYTLNTKNVL